MQWVSHIPYFIVKPITTIFLQMFSDIGEHLLHDASISFDGRVCQVPSNTPYFRMA